MKIYVDVDGTMTNEDVRNSVDNSTPRQELIDKVKRYIEEGHEIVIWTARSKEYAAKAAKKFGIDAVACISKPHVIVDDKPGTLKKRLHRRVRSIEEFMEME